MSYVYLLIKPHANHYTEIIIKFLEKRLGFYIMDRKLLKLNNEDVASIDEARDFLEGLCNSQEELETLQLNETQWIGELCVIQVSKTAGREEMIAILQDCTFDLEGLNNIRLPLKKRDLDLLMFPIWNSKAEVTL